MKKKDLRKIELLNNLNVIVFELTSVNDFLPIHFNEKLYEEKIDSSVYVKHYSLINNLHKFCMRKWSIHFYMKDVEKHRGAKQNLKAI